MCKAISSRKKSLGTVDNPNIIKEKIITKERKGDSLLFVVEIFIILKNT